MRYYAIRVLNPDTGSVVTFSDSLGKFVDNLTATATWSSHLLPGVVDPGAPLVELDIPSLPFGTFQGGANLKVWGPSVAALNQANNLSGYNVEVLGGMAPPFNDLNKNAKAGQLALGQIFQGFGNWEGVNQYLHLILMNASVNPDLTADIGFNWTVNLDLGTAISNALTAAFPGFTVVSTITRLVQDHDEQGHYDSLTAFAEYLLEATQTEDYSGVQLRAVGQTIYVYDNTVSGPVIQLQFSDLIGQPTWMAAAGINFACPMRADIGLGTQIQFPSGLFPPYALTTPQAAVPGAPSTSKLTFQGTFTVTEAHHYGHSRQADAESWRTGYVAVPNTAPNP